MNTDRSFHRLLWTLAILALTIDIGSKYAAFQVLGRSETGERVVVEGAFKLIAQFTDQPIESGTWREPLQAWNGPTLPRVNHGALFGLGNTGGFTSNGLFMIVSVVAAAIIAGWSFRGTATKDGVLCAALGLILGGTLGNLFDRIIFHGVRDFLYFHWFEWPVFNVADCCLVCGAGLLVIQAIWPTKTTTIKSESPAKMVAAL